jgi:type I restriction enzyme S subunit
MNNVTPEGLLDYSRQRRVPRTSPRLDSFLVEAGDVLFNATNSPELVGKTAFFPGHNEPVAFSNHFLRLRPDARQLDGRFLARWLQLQFQRGVFQGLCRQWVNQATVGRDALLGLRLPLPPLAEQRRIASILDRADALRAKRRAALAHLDALPQSLFADLFGAQETLLKKWSTQRLGDLLDFLTSGSRGWATYYASAGDIFLRIQNVRSDELLLNDIAYVRAPETAEALRTRVQPGDVLLSITADLGRTAVVPDDLGVGYINQHLSILRSTRIRPRFLSGYLASSTGQRQINGRNRQGVKAGLNFDDIRSLVIPVPPAALQADFEARLESVAALKASTKSSLAHLDALFACLQYRAFRGEL